MNMADAEGEDPGGERRSRPDPSRLRERVNLTRRLAENSYRTFFGMDELAVSLRAKRLLQGFLVQNKVFEIPYIWQTRKEKFRGAREEADRIRARLRELVNFSRHLADIVYGSFVLTDKLAVLPRVRRPSKGFW